jgi:hypothetical protein
MLASDGLELSKSCREAAVHDGHPTLFPIPDLQSLETLAVVFRSSLEFMVSVGKSLAAIIVYFDFQFVTILTLIQI